METIDISLIEWSKAVVGLLAGFYWLFAPMTLGLSGVLCVTETIYVSTGAEKWLKTTHFWGRIFAVNWVATVGAGLMLLFAIGMYWANFAWWTADVLSVPLMLCAVVVFFLQSAFIAVMYLGWNRGKVFHLLSTYLSLGGALITLLCLSSVISWMQNPVGMTFNPTTARCEITDFSAMLFSEGTFYNFHHIASVSFMMAGILVIAVGSCFFWYGRYREQATDSIKIGAVIALMAMIGVVFTGVQNIEYVHSTQNVKWAATHRARLDADTTRLANLDVQHWVEADSINGNLSVYEKIKRGREAHRTLYTLNDTEKGTLAHEIALRKFYDPVWIKDYFSYFGYGYFYDPDSSVMEENARYMLPDSTLVGGAFSVMKCSGIYLFMIIVLALVLSFVRRYEGKKWFSTLSMIALVVVYLSSYAGWIVSEVGHHPWLVKDLMPMHAAVSSMPVMAVQLEFVAIGLFLVFLMVIEIKVISNIVKKGFN